jgi:hypothetical protein
MVMSAKNRLTKAEIAAWNALARAARRLLEAQRRAKESRQRDQYNERSHRPGESTTLVKEGVAR